MTFGTCWDGFGMVWGFFFGWVQEGFGRGLTRSKIEIFENVRECFSRVGTPRNSILVTKIEERLIPPICLAPLFFMVLLISYQPGAGGRGPWPLISSPTISGLVDRRDLSSML